MDLKPETRNLKLIAITLLAFWVRVQNLTYHSIWFDEAVSIRWAQSSVARILDVSMHLVEDRLPPLYYLLLKGWVSLAGLTEFSVRFPSVVLGVLLVAAVYAIGRRVFGVRTALLAAALVAVNPFLVWYSQEARMYALAALLGTLTVLAFHRAVTVGGARHWAAMGIFAAAGLYTHLYSGFLLPALALWLLLNPSALKKHWLAFGGTMGAVSVAFVPLALATWRFSGESTPGDPLHGIGGRAWGLLRAFAIWRADVPPSIAQIVLIALAVAVILGSVVALRRRSGWLIILLLTMPFIIASGLMFRSELAFFGERYFIVMVPWLLLLAAAGVTRVLWGENRWRKIATGVGALALVTLTAIPLPGQWSVPAAKEAWRQSAAYLSAHTAPDDVIFIHPEWIRFAFQYYQGQMPTAGETAAYFFAVDDQTDLDTPLNGVVDGHAVVWLIESHLDQPDPDRRVENWFAVRYPLVTELFPPGVTLKGFAPGYQLTNLPAAATPADAEFSGGVRLVGFTVQDETVSARDDFFHPPSGWVHVVLYFSRTDAPPQDTIPFVHLIDGQGQVWGASLERGNDAFHFYPPTRWQSGQIIRQDVDVNLNPATPPGEYMLVVGFGDETAELQTVTVK